MQARSQEFTAVLLTRISRIIRNFFRERVFVLKDSFLEFAQNCGLNPPLDPRPGGLSIEGRTVPDYGTPFNFW